MLGRAIRILRGTDSKLLHRDLQRSFPSYTAETAQIGCRSKKEEDPNSSRREIRSSQGGSPETHWSSRASEDGR